MATHDAGFLAPQSQSQSLASRAARRPTHATQAVIEMDTETRILLVEDSSDIVTSSVARLRRHPAAAPPRRRDSSSFTRGQHKPHSCCRDR